MGRGRKPTAASSHGGKKARRTALALGRQMVEQAGPAAFVGRALKKDGNKKGREGRTNLLLLRAKGPHVVSERNSENLSKGRRAMNARKIHGYVAGQIKKYRRSRSTRTRRRWPICGAASAVRRGISSAVGRIFAGSASGAAKRPGQKASPAEWAIYTALTLYALHQQGQSSSMHRSGNGLGYAVHKLAAPEKSPEESSVFRRFNALATASSAEELAHHLRGIIQLLRREGHPARLRAACRRPVLDAVLRNCPAGAPALGRGLLSHAV